MAQQKIVIHGYVWRTNPISTLHFNVFAADKYIDTVKVSFRLPMTVDSLFAVVDRNAAKLNRALSAKYPDLVLQQGYSLKNGYTLLNDMGVPLTRSAARAVDVLIDREAMEEIAKHRSYGIYAIYDIKVVVHNTPNATASQSRPAKRPRQPASDGVERTVKVHPYFGQSETYTVKLPKSMKAGDLFRRVMEIRGNKPRARVDTIWIHTGRARDQFVSADYYDPNQTMKLHYKNVTVSVRLARPGAPGYNSSLGRYANEKNDAATTIQTAWRGAQARAALQDLKYRPGGPGFQAALNDWKNLGGGGGVSPTDSERTLSLSPPSNRRRTPRSATPRSATPRKRCKQDCTAKGKACNPASGRCHTPTRSRTRSPAPAAAGRRSQTNYRARARAILNSGMPMQDATRTKFARYAASNTFTEANKQSIRGQERRLAKGKFPARRSTSPSPRPNKPKSAWNLLLMPSSTK